MLSQISESNFSEFPIKTPKIICFYKENLILFPKLADIV